MRMYDITAGKAGEGSTYSRVDPKATVVSEKVPGTHVLLAPPWPHQREDRVTKAKHLG